MPPGPAPPPPQRKPAAPPKTGMSRQLSNAMARQNIRPLPPMEASPPRPTSAAQRRQAMMGSPLPGVVARSVSASELPLRRSPSVEAPLICIPGATPVAAPSPASFCMRRMSGGLLPVPRSWVEPPIGNVPATGSSATPTAAAMVGSRGSLVSSSSSAAPCSVPFTEPRADGGIMMRATPRKGSMSSIGEEAVQASSTLDEMLAEKGVCKRMMAMLLEMQKRCQERLATLPEETSFAEERASQVEAETAAAAEAAALEEQRRKATVVAAQDCGEADAACLLEAGTSSSEAAAPGDSDAAKRKRPPALMSPVYRRSTHAAGLAHGNEDGPRSPTSPTTPSRAGAGAFGSSPTAEGCGARSGRRVRISEDAAEADSADELKPIGEESSEKAEKPATPVAPMETAVSGTASGSAVGSASISSPGGVSTSASAATNASSPETPAPLNLGDLDVGEDGISSAGEEGEQIISPGPTSTASAVDSSPAMKRLKSVVKAASVIRKTSSRRKKAGSRKETKCLKNISLDAGVGVRQAIAIQEEVWAADTTGNVMVREKDNPEKVKAELPCPESALCLALLRVEPAPMVWVGQERVGIRVFHAPSRQPLCMLKGGHKGNVVAFATEAAPRGNDIIMNVWSASNDFSIRCWHVEMLGSCTNPEASVLGAITSLPEGLYPRLQIRRGAVLNGHMNAVRSLLRNNLLPIGPTLWSGSDDKCIRIWRCEDEAPECEEVISDAHSLGVLCLIVAGRGVWSSGYDGYVKEWCVVGASRQCTRQLNFGEPLRSLVPVGGDVWVCGQSRDIMVYTQDMVYKKSLSGHSSYVSSLCTVDTTETITLWSSSFGDNSLRVWRQVEEGASYMERLVENRIYHEQRVLAEKELQFMRAVEQSLRNELSHAAAEFESRLEQAIARAALAEMQKDEAETARDEAAASRDKMKAELDEAQVALQQALEARLDYATKAGEAKAALEELQERRPTGWPCCSGVSQRLRSCETWQEKAPQKRSDWGWKLRR
eukprot:TRINITY_DN55844_c0_g1_i2.p1 TRINITY_DN55844_c0_g1~~TRINITY_DN55844_c0_g1_i2.p1  ORF type:complete len:1002 (+),score=238.10 TRINITY_DN55844_c0_g1_i2:75-3080(+)